MSAALRWSGALLCIVLALSGCGRNAHKIVMSHGGPALNMPREQRATESKSVGGQEAPRPTLAITRSLDIEHEADAVAPAFTAARGACEAEAASGCTVLEANLTTGTSPRASLTLRAAPAGIARILAKLHSTDGVVSETTSAEDLAAPLFDAERRLAMQREYRDALLALRAKGSNDINALIRVNQELAQVQSQLETVNGERAHLQQQIATEKLNIAFSTIAGDGDGSHPVARSLQEFGSHLAEAAGGAITFVAFVIPWCVFIVPLVWLFVRMRRRRRNAA
ncbi:MAG: DUF4349 domain-containing protein [Burkholderiaceae bacterium]